MKVYSAIGKQLFGPKYKGVFNSIYISGILFFAFFASGMRMSIAPKVLYLTAFVFSGGIMWDNLTSRRNEELFQGLFALPFAPGRLKAALVLGFALCTFITRSLPVLALFYGVGEWRPIQVLFSILCPFFSCIQVAAWYTMVHARIRGVKGHSRLDPLGVLALLWACVSVSSILFAKSFWVTAAVLGIGLVPALLLLEKADPYVFYQNAPIRKRVRVAYRRGSLFRYFFRVLRLTPVYTRNTLFLGAFACLLPFLFHQMEGFSLLPLGFAVLSINTPVCTMLSADPDTEMGVRTLPGQLGQFLVRYALFIFVINLSLDGAYLLAWRVSGGEVTWMEGLLLVLFAGQSALFSAFLEWRYPLLHWRVETDLWHHPRKYLVPGVMILLAGVLALWPMLLWFWAGGMLVEVAFLWWAMGVNK